MFEQAALTCGGEEVVSLYHNCEAAYVNVVVANVQQQFW